MEFPGVKRASEQHKVSLQERISLFLGSRDSFSLNYASLFAHCVIFLELAQVHAHLGNMPEASKAMQDAKNEFEHTSESVRITIADAELAITRRDFTAALTMLRNVPTDSVYYARAKMKMADIYLKHKRNKKLYAACYQELAYQQNTTHTFILLGEAYMRIQEPDKAIKAYQGALKVNPNDAQLMSRIGKALVTTHDYDRAVKYYEGAAQEAEETGSSNRVYLFQELANLYLKLRHYEEAVRVLSMALERKENGGNEF